MDLAKLMQDLELCWAYRRYKLNDMKVIYPRLTIIYIYLKEKINSIFTKEEKKILEYLIVINSLRIIPYASINERKMIKKKVNAIMGNQ